MADQKISELTALTGANVADDDAIAIVDTSATETKKIVFSELKNALDTATGFVRITGDTMTGNLSMGDNVKAIFGAGSDLQIYSDGTNGYIEEAGGGNLRIITNGPSVAINKGTVGGENMAVFNADGAVQLFYDNSQKLATTSTGIDVTGTVTADSLTVDDGDILLDSSTQAFLKLDRGTAASHYALTRYYTGGTEEWRTGTYNDASSNFYVGTPSGKYLSLTSGGDISFYEDTGTTPKMVWKSADERLGIGTSSPSAKLTSAGVTGTTIIQALGADTDGFADVEIKSTGTSGASRLYFSDTAAQSGLIRYGHNTNSMEFYSNGSEAMRIDSSGNVLISGTNTTPNTNSAGTTADNEMALRSDGLALFSAYKSTANDGVVMDINRTSTDGGILGFRKNGTTVGSIGTTGGRLYIGDGTVALRIVGDADEITPWNATANTNRDAAIALGNSTNRFTDLYLSGGVYLGGTGAANYLNDVEYGTYSLADASSASLTLTVRYAVYKKVGQLVHVEFDIDYPSNTNGANAQLTIPFTPNVTYFSGIVGWSNNAVPIKIHGASSGAYLMDCANSGAGNTHLTNANLSSTRIIGSFYYSAT